jgi:hypothetical protein
MWAIAGVNWEDWVIATLMMSAVGLWVITQLRIWRPVGGARVRLQFVIEGGQERQ